ncbi:hypothetical protein LB506_009415 [Fusarium annulatum]|nr:hypothetical protein LB506_009415 [Fusarium annulatum]
MHVFERALPLALTVFCGVVGGFYTFQPIFANDAQKNLDSPPRSLIPNENETGERKKAARNN